MTILLSCFSARELNTRTRNCVPAAAVLHKGVEGDCVTHSRGQDVKRWREYEVCQTKSLPGSCHPSRRKTENESDRERDESGFIRSRPESQ